MQSAKTPDDRDCGHLIRELKAEVAALRSEVAAFRASSPASVIVPTWSSENWSRAIIRFSSTVMSFDTDAIPLPPPWCTEEMSGVPPAPPTSLRHQQWRRVTSLPEVKGGLENATAVRIFIRTLSGISERWLLMGGGDKVPHAMVHCYDPFVRQWTQLQSMRRVRHSHAAAVVKGYVYVTGGNSLNNKCCEVYDIHNDCWFDIPPMHQPRMYHSSCAYQGHVYVFGGCESFNNSSTALASCERYDPLTQKWTLLTPRPGNGFHGAAAVVMSNVEDTKGLDVIVLLGGGHGGPGGLPTVISDRMWMYHPLANQWSEARWRLPRPITHSSALAIPQWDHSNKHTMRQAMREAHVSLGDFPLGVMELMVSYLLFGDHSIWVVCGFLDAQVVASGACWVRDGLTHEWREVHSLRLPNGGCVATL
jgi:hypothetical protein